MSFSLFLVFPKAGVDGWKGLVPGLNFIEWCKIIGRPSWWAALLLLPIVNIFIFAGMAVDLVRSFDLLKLWHSAAAVFYAPAIFAKIGAGDDTSYTGPILDREKAYAQEIAQAQEAGQTKKVQRLLEKNPYRKSGGREWVESIFFAVFAAAFIRMFLIEAYVIPTPSMEGSLNVGDFLFVSKVAYGIRTPMTLAMVPLLHNRLPFFNGESYLKNPSLPYFRLKPLRNIEHKSPIVFNWPVGDSVYLAKARSFTVDQVNRGKPGIFRNYPELRKMEANKDFIVRPIDKKDFYIKRCIALPGDSLEIRDKEVYINGQLQPAPSKVQFKYLVQFPSGFNTKKLDEWGIDSGDMPPGGRPGQTGFYDLDNEQYERLKAIGGMKVELVPHESEPREMFPNDPKNFPNWSRDNYGPIYIPKKGATVQLRPDNIALYRRIIDVYENNDYERKNGQILINGEAATSYTFKQDYFWGMGDNRHNSEDSRSWGFIPHDHIVGKPLFIWFSTKNGNIRKGINWDRVLKSANVQ